MRGEMERFHAFTLAEDVSQTAPQVAQRLQEVMDRVKSLTQGLDDESIHDDDTTSMEFDGSSEEARATCLPSSASHIPLGESGSDQTACDQSLQNIGEETWRTTASNMTAASSAMQQGHKFAFENSGCQILASGTTSCGPRAFDMVTDIGFLLPPQLQVPPTSSGSRHGANFSRRLRRDLLETGLMLATMPDPPLEKYAAMFGYCLLFETVEHLVQRISLALKHVMDDSAPLLKPGTLRPLPSLSTSLAMRPGTCHIPHDDLSGRCSWGDLQKPDCSAAFEDDSPIRKALCDVLVDDKIQMLYAGFEDDFFDTDGVEAYLRERGIVIPVHADFVDLDIDLIQFFDDPSPLFNNFSQIEGPANHVGASGSNFGLYKHVQESRDVISGIWPNPVSLDEADVALASHQGWANFSQQTCTDEKGFDTTVANGSLCFSDTAEPGQLWAAPPRPSLPRTKITISTEVLILGEF